MKIRSCDLVWRVGTVDSATPHPDPSGGQAPRLAKSSTALHFLIPPSTIGLQFGTFRRRRAGTEGDWRAHPGSESGACFRSAHAGAPAHQGMKIRSCDLVWRVGTVDSATPHPDPSGGQAPGEYIFSFRLRPSVYNSARFAGGEPGRRAIGGRIPDRSPGHAFVANRSCRLPPAHQGMKIRSCDLVWRVGTVDSATPHPDPSGGQAPALRPSVYNFLIPPSTIGLQFGTFRRRRAGTEGDWRAHPLWIGVRGMLSCQSLMPVGAGTPRYENPEL